MNASRDQFFGYAPLKDVNDSTDPLIDRCSGQAFVDHALSECLEAERAEVGCDRFAVELPERS
jgi:hypothetical protein